MEKTLRSVSFEFEDGSVKVLKNEELVQWEVLCLGYSDYLLPGNFNHILAQAYNGLARGFVPQSALAGAWQKMRKEVSQ